MKIVVLGASGRMGQELARAVAGSAELALSGVSRSGKADGYSTVRKSLLEFDDTEIDVVIDFSVQEAFQDNLKLVAMKKKPLVSGVTGLTAQDQEALQEVSAHIPVLWASNMSLGVAVLMEALETFSALKGFDFQIEELHHNKKRDNPSGTALSLQARLNKVTAKDNPHPIGIRGGGIFGIHKVWAMSDQETLCFEHQALNRAVFAKGALTAAAWIEKRSVGLYQMKDVLLS